MSNQNNDDVYKALENWENWQKDRAVMVLACRDLHEQGYSLRDIGEVLGVSHEWVRRALLPQSSIVTVNVTDKTIN